MDLGLDPVHREGHQTHAHLGIEALDRFHQSDVAFLDQVGLGQPVARVAASDVDDEAQVRKDHLPSGLEVLMIEEALSQLALLLDGKQRQAVYGLHVGLEIGSRDQGVNRLQRSCHAVPPDVKLLQCSTGPYDCKGCG